MVDISKDIEMRSCWTHNRPFDMKRKGNKYKDMEEMVMGQQSWKVES